MKSEARLVPDAAQHGSHQDRGGRLAERGRRWHRDLPEAFQEPGVLTFIAAQLAWRQGKPTPVMPAGMTSEKLSALLDRLRNPRIRNAVVMELSVPTRRRAWP